MREIRFRAWDKLKHSIVDVACINWVDGYALLWKRTGSARATYGAELDSIELIQYTGLHDKNDKEIYEGDILSDQAHTHNPHIVIEENGAFAESKPNGWRHWLHDCVDYNHKTMSEIIGNIHENGDLLNESK